MLLQLLLASLLALNGADGVTVAPPVGDSHTEASNIETAKIGYDYSPGSGGERQTQGASRQLDAAWAYQPFIEYANVSPHSKSITQIAFGKDAVEALQKSKEQQHQTHRNILYLQSEVAKPVDNQLQPVQSEAHNPNYVYVDAGKYNQGHPSVVYLPPAGAPPQEVYGSQQAAPGQVVFYSQVPQQPHPVPHGENVVYITPQPNSEYDAPVQPVPVQQNYYLVSHVQPSGPGVDTNQNVHGTEQRDEDHKKTKNVVVDSIKKEDKKGGDDKKDDKDKDEHKDEQVLVESNTAKAIIEEYERHYVKRRKNVDVKVDGESGTTQSPYPSATTPLAITKAGPLSRQPIVVADLEENNLEFDDKAFSTTQSTIKTVKTSSSLYHATQPLIVTPRPLGTTFLAPITAGVQLQAVDGRDQKKPKDSVVVEIQKSVPYYLGKFEFVQNDGNPTKNDEIKQNVDLGANLLKYSIERLPDPQAFISEFNNSGAGPVLNQLAYTTIVDHGDQEQESGQFDYKVQNAPSYQQALAPEVTKLEKVPEEELAQHQAAQQLQQPPHLPVRQVYLPPPQIVSVPIKTVADYVQKHVQHHVAPIIPPQAHYNPQPVLLEPFPTVTKLIPQFVPLKHHQEVQKVPMKSYSYAPSYQPSHYHHHQPHNYQIAHGYKKAKNPPPQNYQYSHAGANYFHTVKFNDYIGMKPPKAHSLQHVASSTSGAGAPAPSLSGPPFKASQHLQTVHEYLPATQLTDQQARKYRNPRHSFGSSIRLEYGFMPPLIPSIEIDEFGKPIDKSEA